MSLFIDLTVQAERCVWRPNPAELVIQFVAIDAFARNWIASIDRQLKIQMLDRCRGLGENLVQLLHGKPQMVITPRWSTVISPAPSLERPAFVSAQTPPPTRAPHALVRQADLGRSRLWPYVRSNDDVLGGRRPPMRLEWVEAIPSAHRDPASGRRPKRSGLRAKAPLGCFRQRLRGSA